MQELRIKNHEKGEWMGNDYLSASHTMVPEPAVSTSPGNLVEMQIWGPNTKSTKSETLRVVFTNLCLNILEKILVSPLGISDTC